MKAYAKVHGEKVTSAADNDNNNENKVVEFECDHIPSISAFYITVVKQMIYAALGVFGWLALTENRDEGDNISDTTHTIQSTAIRNTILASIYLRVFIGSPLLIYQAYDLLGRSHEQAKIAASNHDNDDIPTFTGSTRISSGHSECCQVLTLRLFILCQCIYGLTDVLQAYVSDYEGPVEANNTGIISDPSDSTGFDGHGEAHKNLAHCMVASMLLVHFLYLYILLSTGNGIRTNDICNMNSDQSNSSTNLIGMTWEISRVIGVFGIVVTLLYNTYISIWLAVNFWAVNWLEMEWNLPTSIGLMYVFTSLTFR